MADPICAPYADEPLFVDVANGATDEDMIDQLIVDLNIEQEVIPGQKAEVRKGIDNSDKANLGKIAFELENMKAMSITQVNRYVDNRIAAINRGNSKVKNRDKQQVVAAMDAYYSRRGAGLKTLATNYLIQRKQGEKGVAQAIAFLQQMKAFSDQGLKLQQMNLDVGSALRQRKLGKGMTRPLDELQPDITQVQPEDLMTAAQGQLNAFDEIAGLMRQGNVNAALMQAEKLAKQFELMDDPRMVAGVMNRWKGTWNTWDEVWINGLLSAPATFTTNVAAAAWVVMRPLMQLGAAQAYAALNLPAAPTARLAAAEAGAYIGAMRASFLDALTLGWQAAKTETSILQPTSKNITAANAQLAFGDVERFGLGKAVNDPDVAKIINVVGGLVRLPQRGMLGADEFAKVIALRGEVAAQGVRKAVLAGIDPSDQKGLSSYIARETELAFNVNAGSLKERYAFNPYDKTGEYDPNSQAAIYNMNSQLGSEQTNEFMPEGMSGRNIDQRSRKAVFQEENRLANAVGKWRQLPVVGGAIKPFIPFVRTPTNILKQGVIEGTGLGAGFEGLKIAGQQRFRPTKTIRAIQRQMLEDPADSFMIAGQIGFTTLLAGVTFGWAMDGILTGGGPGQWSTGAQSKKAQDAWLQSGNVPYSLRLGDIAVPLERLGEPVSIFLRMMADIGMYSGYMTEQEKDINVAYAVSMGAAGLFDASFLRGIDNLLRIARSTGDGAAFDFELGRGVQNYIATQTPFGGLLAYADRVVDPYRSAYEGATFTEMMNFAEIELGRGIFGKLVNKIPGLGDQPMLIDQLTNEPVPIIPGTGPNGLNPLQQAIPFMPRNSPADEVWKAVMDIQGSYSEKNFGSEFKITASEQQAFNKEMATVTIDGKTVRQAILSFRQRSDVIEFVKKNGVVLSNSKIQNEFKKLIDRYAQKAKANMVVGVPNLLERQVLIEARRRANLQGEADQVRVIDEQIEALILRARRGY